MKCGCVTGYLLDKNMSAIYILWLRQIIRFIRSKSRVFASLAQPLLYLFALGFGFGPIYARAGQGNYIEFLAPGIICMSVLFTSISSGIEIIWDRQFGFLKETLVAPVSRLEIMIGKTLGGATVAIFQGIFVFGIAYLAGFRPISTNGIFLAFLIMVITGILFTALGTAIASLMEDMHGFQLIMNFIVLPIFFLSGALFPLANLPKILDIITRFDPLSYGVDGIRGALTGVYHFGAGYDILVLCLTTTLLLVIGSILFSKIEIEA